MHAAQVVPGSTKRSVVGGVEWVVSCCGDFQMSGHIQNPGRFTKEELLRIRQDHVDQVQQAHADHETAVEFLQEQEISGPEEKSTE